MKTCFAPIRQHQKLQSVAREKLIPALTASTRDVMGLLVSVLVASAIITLFTWVSGMAISTFIGVSIWGLGFIFLGLAVDQHGPVALFQLTTGIALLVLTLLQNSVSPDFIIVSGVLVGTWVGVVLFKRLAV